MLSEATGAVKTKESDLARLNSDLLQPPSSTNMHFLDIRKGKAVHKEPKVYQTCWNFRDYRE